MEQSILKNVKKILNVSVDDDVFDLDIITHVNSTFSTLYQLGIGPSEGFMIEDDTALWASFLGSDPRLLNQVKTYVYLKTRILFDPPTASSFVMGAIEKQITELEWRLNTHREETSWADPDPNLPALPEDRFGNPAVIDGGGA